MKKIFVILLATLFTFNLFACSKTTENQTPNPSETTQSIPTENFQGNTATSQPSISEDPEFMQLIAAGLVPEDLVNDIDKTITFQEFTQLINNYVSYRNVDLLPKWNELSKLAAESDQEMQKQDGMLELFFAVKLLGMDQIAQYDDGIRDVVTKDSIWNKFRESFPQFPGAFGRFDWESGEMENISNLRASYYYSFGRHSRVSGKPLFDFDKEAGSMHITSPFTRGDAILSIARLYNSTPHYVLPEEVTTLQLPEDTLTQSKSMPIVTLSSLPQWYGRELELHNWGHVNHLVYFPQEKDIAEIAEMGFNYIRLEISNYYPYEYSDSLTAQTDNGFMFDSMVLESIANILNYCAKNNIHVALSMKNLPGFGVLWQDDQDILNNPEHYQQALTIWKTVARYFADVPSNLLSYELINEPTGQVFTIETYPEFAQKLIANIQSEDHTNKIIISDGAFVNQGIPDSGIMTPIESMGNGYVQAIHFYPFNADRMSQYISFLNWPYDEAPVVNALYSTDQDPFTLIGNFDSGSQVVLYIRELDSANQGTTLELLADGKQVDSFAFEGIQEGYKNCDSLNNGYATFGNNGRSNGFQVTLRSPQAAQKLEIKIYNPNKKAKILFREALIQTPSETQNITYLPDNGHEGMITENSPWNSTYLFFTNIENEEPQSSTVTINGDGTFSSIPAFEKTPVFDQTLMHQFFAEWSDWSKKTGTPIIVNEYYVPNLLPAKVKEAYLESFLSIMEEYQIPWSYYTANDCGPLIVSKLHPETWNHFRPNMGYEEKGDFYYDMAQINKMQEFMK